jgi:N-acetylmuramoyl-L-alanine amidase
MRKIKYLVLHCSDSDLPAHDNIQVIRDWHTARGFVGPDGVKGTHDDVGYHFFITRSGMVCKGREEHEVGAHVKGHNRFSIGICLSGRSFKSFHTPQFTAARKLVADLLKKYNLTSKDIQLHRDLDSGKTCPNFSIDDFMLSARSGNNTL